MRYTVCVGRRVELFEFIKLEVTTNFLLDTEWHLEWYAQNFDCLWLYFLVVFLVCARDSVNRFRFPLVQSEISPRGLVS